MSELDATVDSRREADVEFEETRMEWLASYLNTRVYVPAKIILGDWRGRVGLSLLIAYFIMGTLGIIWTDRPLYGEGARRMPAFISAQHPMGTNQFGEDLMRQIIHSTPEMLLIVFGGATFAIVVAAIVGLTAGYKGGPTGQALMTFTDIALTLPGLPLIIVLIAVFQPQHPIITGVVLSINAWAGLARTLHSETLSLREESYVEASTLMGVRLHSILLKDILPNVMPYIAVNYMNAARNVIFAAVALYYLGLLPHRQENWGTMLDNGFETVNIMHPTEATMFYIPLLVIVFFSVGLILLAQSMDALFNPRIRARHEERDREREAHTAPEEEPRAGDEMPQSV